MPIYANLRGAEGHKSLLVSVSIVLAQVCTIPRRMSKKHLAVAGTSCSLVAFYWHPAVQSLLWETLYYQVERAAHLVAYQRQELRFQSWCQWYTLTGLWGLFEWLDFIDQHFEVLCATLAISAIGLTYVFDATLRSSTQRHHPQFVSRNQHRHTLVSADRSVWPFMKLRWPVAAQVAQALFQSS